MMSYPLRMIARDFSYLYNCVLLYLLPAIGSPKSGFAPKALLQSFDFVRGLQVIPYTAPTPSGINAWMYVSPTNCPPHTNR